MNKQSLKANTALNTFRMLLTVLVPLITFPYTSRIFLTEGSGQLSFTASVVQVFILFASLGIYTYGVREGTKFRNDRQAFSVFAQELLIINGIATILTYIVFLTCVFLVPSFERHRTLLLINGISIGFSALGLDWVYGVYEEYGYITIRQIIIQIFTIITMFIFVHDLSDIYLWAFLMLLSSTGANIFNCIHARKYIDYRYQKSLSYNIFPHLKPILVLFTTQLAAKVYLNIDTVLLGLQSSEHCVGLYSAAAKLNTILITVFTAMMPVFVPRIVETLNKGENNNYILLLKKIFTFVIALALPAVVGIEMLGGELIKLLAGDAFIDATITIRYLAPIVLITSLSNILYYNVLVPKGKEKSVLICTLVGAIANISLSFILIPVYQENGAAIGSLISEILAFVLSIFYSVRFDKSIKKCVPQVDHYLTGTLAIVVWCVLVKMLINNYIYILFIGIVGSALLYFIILLVTQDVIGLEFIRVAKVLFVRLFLGGK